LPFAIHQPCKFKMPHCTLIPHDSTVPLSVSDSADSAWGWSLYLLVVLEV
jgi:hypothetical protein